MWCSCTVVSTDKVQKYDKTGKKIGFFKEGEARAAAARPMPTPLSLRTPRTAGAVSTVPGKALGAHVLASRRVSALAFTRRSSRTVVAPPR